MQKISGKDILLSAFMNLLQGDAAPINSVDYVYLASEETVRKDVEKHNALVDKENKEHPGEWGMNKIEFNSAEYRMAGDKYVVIYTKTITPYNMSFRDFVRGFLEIMDNEHMPLGIPSDIFTENALIQLYNESKTPDYSRFFPWLDKQPQK